MRKALQKTFALTALASSLLFAGCSEPQSPQSTNQATAPELLVDDSRLGIYHQVPLTADLSHLSDNQKQMLSKLIDASEIMDDLFWKQAFFGDKKAFLQQFSDEELKAFAAINYGPWDRLNGDAPYLSGYGEKAAGAEFYPQDMTKAEFAAAEFADKDGLYSVVERTENGDLTATPYSEKYQAELTKAAALLKEASELADNETFANYLKLRAEALLSDDYYASDMAWMDMKTNPIELVIGPIETYEDQLYGYRAAFESYVLIKDMAWSERLAKYAQFLPELQEGLPVDEAYKQETPGSDADLNAYDVIYYAGHSNAGSKTIAINLPNDERVQLAKGTRRLQLKNAMQAKFDHILKPISEVLIAPEQREHITFNAFFANTMFHEVAHGLGIKNTITDKGTVRAALKEHASALEEGKADILGLYMVQSLLEKGEITEGILEDYYVTFMAGIFRSVRFGASSAHGKANMIRFNYFATMGAFDRNEDGLYSVNMDKMSEAVSSLSELILTLQGNGDYDGVAELVADKGIIKPQLEADLARLKAASIPVDIVFKQGKSQLGL
ncbi:MAG TPA: Zn-dependent hydrolase [Alteromonas sp.]|nr:Zn-dependent hydrolase [Alteromonas sp.]HCA77516.1 Zn-dependent hydrolase [Alteromonas sp.]HCB17464.1 Zn-dependent hydrolase [Alteromonas sp.]HCL13390.1 Zn-dependent hydrolase [Alteromonas sp.]HCV16834.1 Zn-dependent hydrolase [Alteromonas sp.]|tara:strand:+ start:143 stop:1813 length:1671 start_codon:yes stop_codon:yes gene_type:complete